MKYPRSILGRFDRRDASTASFELLPRIRSRLRMHVARLLIPSVVIVACGGRDGGRRWTGAIDTLPAAGIVDTVANTAMRARGHTHGTGASKFGWLLSEEVRISLREGEPQSLAEVVGLDVDGLGHIYVLDRQRQGVQVFDAHGNHVRNIGREGDGSGEFRQANGLALDQRNRLWVVDHHRFSVFDTSGAFLTTHRRTVTLWGFRWDGRFLKNGDLYDVTGIPTGAGRQQALVLYDSLAGFIDTIPLPTDSEERAVWEFTSGTRRMVFPVPFAPGRAWVLDTRGYLWTGLSSEYRLLQLSLSGDVIRVVQHDYRPVPVTVAERDSVVDAVRKRIGGAFVDASKIPQEKPAWVRFLVDDAGYLWVMLSQTHGSRRARFDVFDPEGAYLGSLAAPASISSFEPWLIRRDAMYAVVTDDFDVTFVVRLRIGGR